MGLFTNEALAAMAGGTCPVPPQDYRLPTQFPDFSNARRISLDLESHDPAMAADLGPGWRRDAYTVGISIAIQDLDDKISFSEYYPVGHHDSPNLDRSKVFDWLADNLSFFTGEIVGANLMYDFDGIQYQGITAPIAKYRDVQWAEALLDENALNYQLNTLAKKWLGETKVTSELKILYGNKYFERMREIHPGHMRNYGIGDVTLPLRILAKQKVQLEKEKLTELFDLESRLMPFLLYMRKLGVRVDMDKAEHLQALLIEKRDTALHECSRIVGFEINAENFNKPTVMGRTLDKLGIAYPRTPKNNLPSIKDQWLERLNVPFGDNLVLANRCDKSLGTFVEGYILDYQINGRVHPEFHPLRKVAEGGSRKAGTVSGRFSANNPNIQNIPIRDELIGPLCRELFVPDEGSLWWSQDYSQIEFRFLVHWAVEMKCKGADKAQQMYKNDPKTDFHQMVAEKLVWAKDWQAVQHRLDIGEIPLDSEDKKVVTAKKLWKAIRGPAKNLNFGLVYGMGKDHLAAELDEIDAEGHPTPRALQIMEDYHAGAPFIRDWYNKCSNIAQRLGYITTIARRRRRFTLWEPKDQSNFTSRASALPLEQAMAEYDLPKDKLKLAMTHKAGNGQLQGSAADQIKQAMVDIWESGVLDPGNDITCGLTVHDELNGSVVPSARGEAARAEIAHIMDAARPLGIPLHVPILSSGSTGRDWSEAK
jgi:DNA polymerase I-like protein with 3'-5' exonuclease and polymerase domains